MKRVAVFRVLLLLLALFMAASVSAQDCIAEQEPNGTPPQANPLIGATCISGLLGGQDQDAFAWTVSAEDSRTTWQFELASIRGQLTNVAIFRVEFTDDGTGVLSYDTLLQHATPDGRTATSEPRFFAPGTYILGLSVSGGEGAYTLAMLPGEPIRGFHAEAPDPEFALETAAGFVHNGNLFRKQLFDWTIPPEFAGHLWHLELTAAVGESIDLEIHEPGGSVLASLTADDGRASISSLGVREGTYRLAVTSASGITAPFQLSATPQGLATAGQEIEPNSSAEQANALHLGEELLGALSAGGDTDYYRFVVNEEESSHLLELDTGTDGTVEVCLLDARNTSLQCRMGIGLPDLKLAAGEYGLRLRADNNETDLGYALLLRDAGEPNPLRPTEPNDGIDRAFPIPESLGVRGELYSEEEDFLSVDITGDPQLWRVQVNGPGVGELAHYNAAGQQVARDRGPGNVRLDNLYLLPGTHYFSVRGMNTAYTLRLLPMGPPVDQPQTTVTDPEESPDTAPRQDRPPGLPEREPNNGTTSADLLDFEGPRIGLLTTGNDVDYYRFTLAAAQHVRLTVTPPADSRIVSTMYWGSHSLGRAYPGENGLITGQEWLPAGEYFLQVAAEVPGEEWYQVQLERLDPFNVPPGRDSHYPEWFGRYEAEETPYSPAELDVALSLQPATVDTVAAYWPSGQQFDLELTISNPAAEVTELSLDWHASDDRWQLDLPDGMTISAGETTAVRVPAVIAPDAPDEPVILTVRARAADGQRATVAMNITPDPMTNPVGSHIWHGLPPELLGGLDAAWSGLGAALITSTAEEETLIARFEVPLLFNGMAPLHHAHMHYRMHDRVASETSLSEFPLTVRLAGQEPLELAGFLLNPTATGNPARSLRDFSVSVSLDGVEFSEVLRGILSPSQTEQAFVLPEPVSARYVRLHLLSNQLPSDQPHRDDMFIGTFKAVTTLEAASLLSGGSGLNIADSAIGGHVVWAEPASIAASNRMLRLDGNIQSVRTDFEQDSVHWVIGFHHHRAAQIVQLDWLDHEGAANPFQTVDLSVALDSPSGPWTPVGTWNLGTASFNLDEPVWARYVRITATGLTPRDTYQLPEAISIIERSPDSDYASVAGEWGHYSRLGPYEQMSDQAELQSATVTDNGSSESAAELAPGQLLAGTVELGEKEAWYRITVPAGQNHLSVTLTGQPHRGFDFELTDAVGEPVRTEQNSTSTEIAMTASVQPGDYLLRIFEPPRSVVITWDTSGSVAGSLPIIYGALERFAESISPGIEEVNLLPFDSPFLLRNWSGDPLRVLEAIQANPRNSSSSSGETALLRATQALAERPGKKAIILLTDGAIVSDDGLWTALAETRPHIFASSISSAGDLGPNPVAEQDRMQSYASVNGGHYEYVRAQGDFDVTFRRAAAWLRRPSNYTVSVETDLRWANASAWAESELQRAADHGLIPEVLAGADLTGPVTRAEFAAVAVRVYEVITGEEAMPVTDNPFSDTDDPEVLKAFNTELAVGISPTEFAPDQLLNREQAATILTRVYKKVNLPGWTWASDAEFPLEFPAPEPFADHERISAWARESVYFMAANGIITGTGNNAFTPRAITPEEQAMGYANATREQALLLAVRLVESR